MRARRTNAIVGTAASMACSANTPSAMAGAGRPTAKSHSSAAAGVVSSTSVRSSVATATPSCHRRVRPDAYGPHASASVTIAPAPRAARAATA
jgi:hypothetical protein